MRSMLFSKSEIEILVLVARSEQALYPRDLSQTLDLHPRTRSRVITSLINKGLLEREGKEIALAKTPVAESFKRLYFAHRATPLLLLIADRRVDLLYKMDSVPQSVGVLEKEISIPKKTIYRYLKELLHIGVVRRIKQGRTYLYSFNYILWPELKDFVTALLEYQALSLVPREALLIKSYGDSVLFKSIRPQDATFTSFSAYEKYGIDLGLRDYYYTLPKRVLSIKKVFIHSLDSAEDLRQRLFCILFYLKNRDKLEDIDHPMMEDIKAVLQGETIKGYSSLEEIKDRAELYGIGL